MTPIGNLTSKIASSLKGSDLTPDEPQPSSAITGLPSPARPRSSTGGPLGAPGAVAPLSDCLRGADAWATDKALLASLPPPVARSLVSKVNEDFDVVGYDLKPGCGAEDLAEALAIVEQVCVPSQAREVMQELVRLNSVTKARDHDEIDREMSYVAMAEGLSDFPADVIRDACRAYARCHKWRPSLAELREFCWPRFRARDSLRQALRRAM